MQNEPFLVTYCTNVHPGESVGAVIKTLDEIVPAVKAHVCADGTFGVGLRLGHEATSTLHRDQDARNRLCDVLVKQDFDVFTVNGFPYGTFGEGVVKTSVYEPDWRDPRRVEYTIQLAEVLAALPGPSVRTISTVAGGFRPKTCTEEDRILMGKNLLRVASALRDLAEASGTQIRLCLEPEPWTTMETTDDAVGFFQQHLSPGTELVDAHLGLCYDCCHQAVHFEDPRDAINQIYDSGIVIGKVQVSSAIHLPNPADDQARQALLNFAEPRFLHQVVAQRRDGSILRMMDLDELVDPHPEWLAAEAWRCHFHVPIDWEGDALLKTTRRDWETVLSVIQTRGQAPHLEIETYTWHVLPPNLQPSGQPALCRAIADEFDCLSACLKRVV
ncbi:MAG: metabolite traffic protein EboE [Myxococcota bacterium]|nr:metabolite traffic protein EboE [Myxococcota bacterium]